MGAPENPPAFPSIETHPSFDMPVHHFGMGLRDYFAGQALGPCLVELVKAGTVANGTFSEQLPKMAGALYAAADAMLVERAKGGAE